MTKFTDNLWRDLARERGEALAQAGRPEADRTRRPSPGVIASSTLVLAVGGTALGLGLTSAGGTSATTTGSAATTTIVTVAEISSGEILVTLNQPGSLAMQQADKKLAAMGFQEGIVIYMGSGPASVSGPVTCSPMSGIPNQPTVKVVVGANGTQVVRPGTTGDNTGVGTWHLNHCDLVSDTRTGNTGAG
jgi:hypothetical protein